jgi:hypothetical protein
MIFCFAGRRRVSAGIAEILRPSRRPLEFHQPAPIATIVFKGGYAAVDTPLRPLRKLCASARNKFFPPLEPAHD